MHWQPLRRRRAPTLDWIVTGPAPAAVSRPCMVRSDSSPQSIEAALAQFAVERAVQWRGLRVLEVVGGDSLANYFAERRLANHVLLAPPASAGRLAEQYPNSRVLSGTTKDLCRSGRRKFDWIIAGHPVAELSYLSRRGESSNRAAIEDSLANRQLLAGLVAAGGMMALTDRLRSANDPDWVGQRSLLERAGLSIARRLPIAADRCLTLWRRQS